MTATDVPAAARGPAIDSARGYLVEELRGGAWRMTDGAYQALLAPRRQGRWWSTPAVAGAASARHRGGGPGAPLTRLISSHSHYDHIGAAHLFGDATVIGHAEVATTLRR